MKAMVLAAGVGSRLEPLTSQIPKPLVPIANRPVMEHIVQLLAKNQFTDLIANLHHLPDALKSHFGDGTAFGVNLQYHYEAELSGDAGGVRACRAFLEKDTFCVIMGDVLTDANLSQIVKKHKEAGAIATIVLKKVDDVSQFGVAVCDEAGFIKGFQEKPTQQEALSDLASTGIYILEPEVFKYIPESGQYGFGRQLFPDLVKRGLPVLGLTISDYWSDVGTIKQYRSSNFDALCGKIKLAMPGNPTEFGFVGEGSRIESDCRIEGKLMLGKNSVLKSGVIIRGQVIIGDNCKVGLGAEIEDSIIWSESKIQPHAKLKNCVIGMNCCIPNSVEHLEMACVP